MIMGVFLLIEFIDTQNEIIHNWITIVSENQIDLLIKVSNATPR